jgi:nucleoside-diphosphate-sugar epimerase
MHSKIYGFLFPNVLKNGKYPHTNTPVGKIHCNYRFILNTFLKKLILPKLYQISMKTDIILIIGANGQVGSALTPKLQAIYGENNVIASDISPATNHTGIFEILDATDASALNAIAKKYKITQIYHLAAVLSAKAEADPAWAWNLNMQTLINVLETAKECKLSKLFIPSSIAAFGKSVAGSKVMQKVYLDPSTIYGVSKVATENLLYYYFSRYSLDIRSLRYPGVISHQSMPGGGTTDYAVHMYHEAIKNEPYTCFLNEHTKLPMIYIDDALRATVELMEAPAENIKIRSSYNLAGISFTPIELLQNIQQYFPDFQCEFRPDFRQFIADSWPGSIDDTDAAADWGWKTAYTLDQMTTQMIAHLSKPKLTLH